MKELDKNCMVKNIILIACLLGFFGTESSMAQMKGNATKLPGIWKYDGGSGYEVWEAREDYLVGSGYRTTKFNDTIKVEDLKLTLVNKRLIYSLTTKQQSDSGVVIHSYKFIGSGKRKLHFVNIENESPREVSYSFGLFNKKRLKIRIKYDGMEKPEVLKLTKASEI